MSIGRIAWFECVRWAEYEGFDDEETESLMDLIDKLDQEEIKLSQKDKPKPKD